MPHTLEEGRIEAIYEAAVVPELWPQVIDDLVNLTDAAFGSLFVVHPDQPRWVGTPAAEALISDFYARAHPNLVNPRIAAGMAYESPGFFTDYDLFTEDEIARNPFYQEFMYPRGYGWTAGTKLAAPSGDTAFFTLERRTGRGNFEPAFVDLLDSLRPHLARAALLASRLDLQRARTMAQALDVVGLPAAVLHTGGALYAANAGFEKLIPRVVRDRGQRLAFVDPGADSLFATAIANTVLFRDVSRSCSIPVASRESHPAIIFHLLPVCRAAHDVFALADSVLIATALDRRAAPSATVLQGLFDLTPAEARIARGIAEGQSIAALAVAMGVSRNTIRTQLGAVLAKTGFHRQADLASFLSGAQIPR